MKRIATLLVAIVMAWTLFGCAAPAPAESKAPAATPEPVAEEPAPVDTEEPQTAQEPEPVAGVPAEKLTLGLIQLAFTEGDEAANIAAAKDLVKDAVDRGAELVVLPELWSIGYGPENPGSYAKGRDDSDCYQFMKAAAAEHGVYVCGGWAELGDDNLPYNSAVMFDPEGNEILNHRKVELYTPGGEDKVWTAGDTYETVDTSFGKVGVLICYDGDFPESWRILADQGAQLILHVTAYESPCEDCGWWDKLYEAGAMSNAVWCASANLAGQLSSGANLFGGSRIIHPYGDTIASAPFVKVDEKAESVVLVETIDFAKGLQEGAEGNGCILTDRRMDVYAEYAKQRDAIDLSTKAAPAEQLKVGLIQFAFVEGDEAANLASAEKLVADAAGQGAELVVLPELWSIGYGPADPGSYAKNRQDSVCYQFMQKAAAEHGVYVCGGWAELGEDGLPYNSAVMFAPDGSEILNHRKVELYTPGGEDEVWTAGNTFEVVDTAFGRVGVLICYDGDFPESWRILKEQGTDLVIHVTAYESPCEDCGWWDKLYEASAMGNAVWCVSANMAGQLSNGCNLFGGSRIIHPYGDTVASAPFVKVDEKAESVVLVETLDFAKGLAEGDEGNGCIFADRRLDAFAAYGY